VNVAKEYWTNTLDNPNGDTALVPWETWKLVAHAVRFLLFVVDNSVGLDGYHRNNAIATWEEFEEFAKIEDNRRALEEIMGEEVRP
jgi:hypothetical protein